MKGVILDADSLGQGQVDLSPITCLLDGWDIHGSTKPHEIRERIDGADIVLSNKIVLDEVTCKSSKSLKFISIMATGTNNVDLTAARNPLYRTPEAALTNAGVCARGIPDNEAAEEYFRQALAHVPGYREALIQLADLNYMTEDYFQARAFLERYLQYGPASADALILGVRIEVAQGDEPAAAAYKQRLETEFPSAAKSL